jgi:hypothetical protein
MHACELVELAAVVAAQGPVLVRHGYPITDRAVEDYWSAAKCRLDRWGRSLKDYAQQTHDTGKSWTSPRWNHARAVLEEVLTGEVLTRVWTAVLTCYDRRHGSQRFEPIARSVLIGHLEARHRVLTLLVQGPGVDSEAAVKLNGLRRRVERWTDLLIGYLSGLADVSEFAIDPQRAEDFAEDLRYQNPMEGGHQAWKLLLSSLRTGFRQGLVPLCPNADLNRKIATSVIAAFPAELFDSTGLFQSLWMTRISSVSDDAAGMLNELMATGGGSASADASNPPPLVSRDGLDIRRPRDLG